VSLYWTGSLSTVDILRNTTGSFSPFTGVTTSDVQDCVGFGVDCEHELLLLIRPYSSGGSLGERSEIIEVRTKPAITNHLYGGGRFKHVCVLDGIVFYRRSSVERPAFHVSDSSLSGLTVSNTTIRGLLAGTKYYLWSSKTVAGVIGVTVSSATTVSGVNNLNDQHDVGENGGVYYVERVVRYGEPPVVDRRIVCGY
jgi:hypothetical protein